jgi:hypothetical protein
MQVSIMQASVVQHDTTTVIGLTFGLFALALIFAPMLSRWMAGK